MLLQSLLPHEVGLLERAAVGRGEVLEPELLQLVLRTELLVVAVAVGVVQRGGSFPVVVDVPSGREQVVVLVEVVGGAGPEAAVGHAVALGAVVARGVDGEGAFGVVGESFVERVEAPESAVVHIFVRAYACLGAIGAVHEAEVVVAGGYAVPSLAGMFVVADILVSDDQIIRCFPRQASVERA